MGSMQNDGTSFPPSEPKHCANGCGFFGTAANKNLCSKCYRDFLFKQEQAVSAKFATEKTLSMMQLAGSKVDVAPQVVVPQSVASSDQSSSLLSEAVIASGNQVPPKLANRCESCNKKVGLRGFKCKCGGLFCGTHRYAENHKCSFDFKGVARDAIAAANPLFKADKLQRF